jgi:type II secretory pathway pseudopilin PulG
MDHDPPVAKQPASEWPPFVKVIVAVGLVGFATSIACPGFVHTREARYESAALGWLRELRSILEAYRNQCGAYPTTLVAVTDRPADRGTCSYEARLQPDAPLARAIRGEAVASYHWEYRAIAEGYELQLVPQQRGNCPRCRFLLADASGRVRYASGRKATHDDPAFE